MSNHIDSNWIHTHKDKWEKKPFEPTDIDEKVKQGQQEHTPAASI